MSRMRRRVDLTHVDDVDAVIHAEMGLYSRAIGERLGLSAGQAQYRVAKGGASPARREWRTGQSPLFRKLSQQVLHENREEEQQRLIKEYTKKRDEQVKERGKIVRATARKKAKQDKARRLRG